MTRIVDYYLSLISPYAYLGSGRFEEIARVRGVEVRVKPVDYGAIFPKTGGLPLAKRAPARQAYRLVELQRWSRACGLPLTLHPKHFPAVEQLAACTVLAAAETDGAPLKLAHAILRAVWVEERNIADAATLEAIADATGHSGINLMARACEPETLESYRALTEEALERGVFGAPTYVLDGELFWGQDRLNFLDQALARA
jgi:2-hydroxychromene-2-carboxylate isomerase